MSKEKDSINHPPHYNKGKIEVIEYIEDQKLGFNLGNAIKYISRAGAKSKTKVVEDLEKARWYILREIELHQPSPRRPNDMTKVPVQGTVETPNDISEACDEQRSQ